MSGMVSGVQVASWRCAVQRVAQNAGSRAYIARPARPLRSGY